jgi:hypothetical protein
MSDRPHRGGDGRPELLCLDDGPLGKVAAGEAGGKAHVVLNLGAVARLPAGGARLDDGRFQPLGGAVDGSRQPGRAGTDDDQIVDGPVDGLRDVQELAELAIAGVLEDALAAQRDHRRRLGGDAEALEQALDAAVVRRRRSSQRASGSC